MSLPPSFFDHLEDRLNIAVYDINESYRMTDLPQNTIAQPDEPKMTITGAKYLGETLKTKVQAAKDRVTSSQAKHDIALDKIHKAAEASDRVANAIEAEADDLMAQLGQWSNSHD